MLSRLCLAVFFALLCLTPAMAQTTPVRDPNAVALASKALQALVGRSTLQDVTLQANANLIAGLDTQAGTATLVARGNGESLVTLNVPGNNLQDIRKGIYGAWVDANGTAHVTSSHNCFVDPAWFYPALSLAALSTDPTLAVGLVGQQTYEGQAVYHLVLYHTVVRKKPSTVALIQRISTMDLYLDVNSFLPVALDFNLHPDNDTNLNIPVEIRYGAYQSSNGVQAPTRIQKYLQNSLVLDLTVTKIAVNSGVPDSVFTLPAVPTGGGQ